MAFLVKGNLAGYLCDDCLEAISHVKIRIYRPELQRDHTAAAVAATKDTFRALTDEQVETKSKRILAEGTTDELGNFEVAIGGNYAGDAFEIDFYCGNVPRFPPKPKLNFESRQFHLTTVLPQWRQSNRETVLENDLIFSWKYTLPAKWWCFIRGFYFDAWTICGHLVDYKQQKPIEGLTVIAMDADFLTDDKLGSAVTDATGHFRIDYTSRDFKQTFLSPFLNLETDVNFPFASGPDVYFLLEYAGNKIPFETVTNRRSNVSYCLCVELCLKPDSIPETTYPSYFTHFGRSARHAIQAGIQAATGKTVVGDNAFYASILLQGSLNKKLNGQPMEYMFEYQEVTNPAAPLTPGGWQPVTPAMIGETNIGFTYTLLPITFENYYINRAPTTLGQDVVLNGNWIQMPQAGNFVPHTDTDILNLNTEAITGVATRNMAGMTIGALTVNAARPHITNRYIAIRMKVREIGSASAGIVAGTSRPIAIFNVRYNNVPKYGSWAPQTVSGQLAVVSLDIVEIVEGLVGCSKITTDLHVKYNVRNENIGSISLQMVGPGLPASSFAPISLGTPEVAGTVTPLPAVVVKDLAPCAYTIQLTATVKLTTGDGGPGPISDLISFCKV